MSLMTITAYQVHDKGEEGERWGEERVGVKELYRQVQACVSEQKYVMFMPSTYENLLPGTTRVHILKISKLLRKIY